MSSVFNVSFKDNLERLKELSDKPASSSSPQATESFVSILERLHPNLKKDSVSSELSKQELNHNQNQDVLTNLPPAELGLAQDKTEIDIRMPYLRQASLSSECSSGVRAIAPDVKVPAPSPTGITLTPPQPADGLPPERPQIAEVRRVAIPQRAPGDSRRSSYSNEEIESIIETAGKFHGVSPELGLAVAHAESSLRFDAVSKDGHFSKGVFQLLDSTAKDLKGRFSLNEEYDPFDPAMNAFLGVGYLKRLHELFSEKNILSGTKSTFAVKSAADLEKLSVAAFNAGEGNVADAQRKALREGKNPGEYSDVAPHLPPSTRTYVDRVISFKTEFAKKYSSSDIG